MRRAEKAEGVELLQGEFSRATVTVLAEYRGLTAGQMNRLRKAVREADGRCRVAKNRLAKRAVAESANEKVVVDGQYRLQSGALVQELHGKAAQEADLQSAVEQAIP